MAEGYTRKQIAEKLGLNINTLKYYCRTRGIKSGAQEQTPERAIYAEAIAGWMISL